MKEPFNEGDTVSIKGEHHLGLHRVDCCEWVTDTAPGVEHYWLVECTEIRDPVDWSKYAPGTTGIVTGSFWRGPAASLVLSQQERQ
jgi:hypothetical protein